MMFSTMHSKYQKRKTKEKKTIKSAEATVDDCFCCCLHKLKTDKMRKQNENEKKTLEYEARKATHTHTAQHDKPECYI